ncbi:hypothetical protein [Streptomyces decoyicus]|uniref:hypothetical protein n=1 Tax=Streptomyces decoyicus TaxID=249567 RepID=UPI002E19FF2B|nr:hypothetical protein OG532_07905 [Streptomyces decoyicus]
MARAGSGLMVKGRPDEQPTVHQQPPADAMDEHPSRPIPQTARFEVQQAVLPDPATDGEPAAP